MIEFICNTYDAWGKQTITKNAMGLTRGYTGHEHWNQFGLIDMNGRFYDPLIGRFLSPDPYVQAPYNLQNFNRYSYCLNNPLKYTDPSGYRIDSFEDEERDSKRSCYYMKQYDGQRCGGGGYSVGDMINKALTNNTRQLIANMSDSWSIYGKETSTVGNWVTYWYEIRGYNNREVYVIAGEIKVYETISNNTKIIMPRSYNEYSSGGGNVTSGASYANTVVNSAYNSAWKNAPNAKLGSNDKIYWEGNFYGNQYVTVKSLSSIAKPIARGTGMLGVGISVYQVYNAYQNEGYYGPESQAATVEAVGGIAGGIAGAKLGAMAGGAIGVWVGGIGAIPGAVIGGVIGGVGGSFGGAYATDKAYEYYINKQ